MDVCCCLQTCNSVVNMLVIGLLLEPSLMVVSLLFNVLRECIVVVFKVHCLQKFEQKGAHWAIKV